MLQMETFTRDDKRYAYPMQDARSHASQRRYQEPAWTHSVRAYATSETRVLYNAAC